jgi:glycerate 2-kinase
MKTLADLRADALEIFHAALHAADPRAAIHRVVQREGNLLLLNGQPFADVTRGRVIVVGMGKAGAPMAQAIEELLDDEIDAGAVTVKYGHVASTRKIKINQAGHPLPDANGVHATQEIVQLLRDLSADDLVICVVSGGGSALMEWLVEGVTLDDLRALTNELLRCGATIYEINTLRKHISRVKGGQLARLAQPARVLALILSDVLGSPLDVIASGPTAPDSSSFKDALSILETRALREKIPATIRAHLERGARGEIPDTPKADDPLFARVTNLIVADNRIACDAAAREAEARGYAVESVGTDLQGEARALGIALAQRGLRARADTCLLGGGEPTVVLHGSGKGGRAQELVLAAAREIAGERNIVVLSAGTDGTDGPTDAAGALADNATLARARALGLDADAFLENNDAYHFFRALNDLVITGPTNTNVNDLMLVLRG